MAGLQGDNRKGTNPGIFAPVSIATATAGVAFNTELKSAIGSPTDFEYFINSDSGNKITRSGVLWLAPGVLSITVTADTVFEVM